MWNFTLSGPPSQKVTHLNLIYNQIQECQIHLDLKNTVRKKVKSRVTKIRGWLQGAEWQWCSRSLYLGHYPYVPSIWTCYAHILLHPVQIIMTVCKQYEHYLCPIPIRDWEGNGIHTVQPIVVSRSPLSRRTASFSRRPLILAGWTEMNINTRTTPTSSSLSTMLHIRKKAIADSCDETGNSWSKM